MQSHHRLNDPRRLTRPRIRQDFIAYQETVIQELRSIQNKIRNLIGQKHWLTDGEHKETAIRNIIRSRLPEIMRIGNGFVCYPSEGTSSTQIDLLITNRLRPTLHQDGELVFVTASSVYAIAEIKTELAGSIRSPNKSNLLFALNHLADNLEFIRHHNDNNCWGGLFIYEQGNISHDILLQALRISAKGSIYRAIDCVSVGDDLFSHFWNNGRIIVDSPVNGPVWHSYDLHHLAPAYFISNLVINVSPDIPDDELLAWFPIEGGKETLRRKYISLNGKAVKEF